MNLYKFHSEPESMKNHDYHNDNVAELFWNKYRKTPIELKKREKAIAKNSEYAYYYARNVLHKRFPLGEEAIAKDPRYAYEYAINVLCDRFPLGEEAIAKSPYYAVEYAKNIIKGPLIINGKTYE